MKSLTYVEIDIPAFVQNSPPDSPVPMTTFRFAVDTTYLPSNIDAIPSIKRVSITPAVLSLGGNLGQRATVEVIFRDHKHIFSSETFDSGTFWGKFRGRYGLKLRGYPLRVIVGKVGDALVNMETRNFVIESTNGPATNGEYKIVAKDVLKFADGDRSQAPALSPGFVLADITAAAGNVTLSPAGIGDSYGPSGLAAIGGKEIVRYTRLGYDSSDVLLVHADSSSPDQIIDALDTPHAITRVGVVNPSTCAEQVRRVVRPVRRRLPPARREQRVRVRHGGLHCRVLLQAQRDGVDALLVRLEADGDQRGLPDYSDHVS
jgi:hypothetical protein